MIPLVVAGGGPAGAIAAALLGRAGLRPLLLERTAGPTHKICGEFISAEALRVMAHAGLDVARLGGHEIGAVRLIRGDRCAESALPFKALGLSRSRLDEALLRHAGDCGVEVSRGNAILNAEAMDGATLLRLADGRNCAAATLFLATGKHDLRGLRRDAAAEDLVGFKMHFTLSPAATRDLAGHVEVFVFDDAYVGLQCVEDGRVNVCLLVRRAHLQRSGGTWEAMLDALLRASPPLRRRLADAIPLFERPMTIFRVPYGFVHRDDGGGAGIFRLGDQAAVIPSFSGDGMAIALHSAALAAKMFLGGADAAAYHRRLRGDVEGQVRRAWRLYQLGATPLGQAAVMRAALLWPATLRLAATWTRVPPRAVAHAAS